MNDQIIDQLRDEVAEMSIKEKVQFCVDVDIFPTDASYMGMPKLNEILDGLILTWKWGTL